MPKKHLIKKICDGGIGMAIDMDMTPNFFNAIIGIKSGAPVRTSFDKGVGLPYYNMLVGKAIDGQAPRLAYKMMADILGNFKP